MPNDQHDRNNHPSNDARNCWKPQFRKLDQHGAEEDHDRDQRSDPPAHRNPIDSDFHITIIIRHVVLWSVGLTCY